MGKRIKVFIAEDSATQLELLLHVLKSTSDIDVIGHAKNGADAIEDLNHLKPDVVLMDMHMPIMNGIEAIKNIMQNRPIPIIAMSASCQTADAITSLNALSAGAIAFAEKPKGLNDPKYKLCCDYLLQMIRLMSDIKVVHRKHQSYLKQPTAVNNNIKYDAPNNIELVAIGASTGGPVVLQEILSKIPENHPPIIIVQHISIGFIHGLAEWLSKTLSKRVEIASNGIIPQFNHIYLAPDDTNIHIGEDYKIILTKNNNKSPCPSIGYLFESIAHQYKNKAVGILLTGMGGDGAKELKMMKNEGAITIAQKKETCVIFGMPAQAISIDAQSYILSPEEIANFITHLRFNGYNHG